MEHFRTIPDDKQKDYSVVVLIHPVVGAFELRYGRSASNILKWDNPFSTSNDWSIKDFEELHDTRSEGVV